MPTRMDRPWSPDLLDDRILRAVQHLGSSAETMRRAGVTLQEAQQRVVLARLRLEELKARDAPDVTLLRARSDRINSQASG
jgi:hypothetical protein